MSRARKTPAWFREATATPTETTCRHPVAGTAQQTLPLAGGENDSQQSDAPVAPAAQAARGKLWFCVYLPCLSLEAAGRRRTPFAVTEERQGVSRIVLANEAAARAGVQPGQSANAALALAPTLELGERSVLAEQQTLEQVAAWLEQFSSFVSIATADVLLLEIAGSLRLFGGLRRLRRTVVDGLASQGYAAALAIAPTPLAATWLARAGQRVCVRDPSNIAAAIRGLPLTCLDWPPSVVESLVGTGVTTVGDCLRLPREGFTRRFGAARLLDLDRATGRLPDPRSGWRTPERFLADCDLNEEQSDRGRLLAVCHELLAKHERFLRCRQLGTQRLNFSFYHLKAPATTLSVGRVSADHSAARWSHLLDLRFERLRLPEPVIAVRLEGGRNEPLETGAERLAFDNDRSGAERYSMTQLAERFSARIGEAAVNGIATVAEHRPHRAWRTRSALGGGAAGAALPERSLCRPLWLLPEPRRLPTEEGRPLHGGRLTLLEGPERLETGWWDEHGITRDYFVAINPHGMRLWVYQCRSVQGDWYLHGLFG